MSSPSHRNLLEPASEHYKTDSLYNIIIHANNYACVAMNAKSRNAGVTETLCDTPRARHIVFSFPSLRENNIYLLIFVHQFVLVNVVFKNTKLA